MCRVGREDEARRVRPPGRIEQAAVPEERAREQLGRAAAPRGALGEPVAPAEIDEAVHVLLMVVDDPFDRVERDGEPGPGSVQVEVHDVAVGRDVLHLREAEQVRAVVVEVLGRVAQRVEHHRLASHLGLLPGTRKEESPLPGVGARIQRLAVRVERAAVTRSVEVEAPGGDARIHVNDSSVLVAVFGVPAAGLEVDLVDHFRIEQLVQAARDTGGHGDAVHVIGVLGVLAADVNFACRGPDGARDRLLQDLGGCVGGRPVVVVLLEDLVARAGVDGERHGGPHLHRREVDELDDALGGAFTAWNAGFAEVLVDDDERLRGDRVGLGAGRV